MGHVPPPFGAEDALLPRPPPGMEKLVSGYCAIEKGRRKIWVESIPEKGQLPKKVKIALGTGGALSTVHPLGIVPP